MPIGGDPAACGRAIGLWQVARGEWACRLRLRGSFRLRKACGEGWQRPTQPPDETSVATATMSPCLASICVPQRFPRRGSRDPWPVRNRRIEASLGPRRSHNWTSAKWTLGLYSSRKSYSSISLKNRHNSLFRRRLRFREEKSRNKIFPFRRRRTQWPFCRSPVIRKTMGQADPATVSMPNGIGGPVGSSAFRRV